VVPSRLSYPLETVVDRSWLYCWLSTIGCGQLLLIVLIVVSCPMLVVLTISQMLLLVVIECCSLWLTGVGCIDH
jgi:hypothetical protein